MTDNSLAANEPRRALALDALRGFAILTMFLSGMIPFGTLPAWMYHAQVPPPAHKWIATIPGISWVDLVFPFFLFSMGAALPIALSGRIKKQPMWKVVSGVFMRGALLAGFAIYDQHIRPYSLNAEPNTVTWLTALLGFALLFPVLARLPESWSETKKYLVKGLGFAGILLFLYFGTYTGSRGPSFSLFRSDIIILVLANVAVGGSLIWLVTRSNLTLRLGILGILAAIRLSHNEIGWIQWLWDNPPFPWLGTLYFQQYLFLILPGTIIGEMLLKWMKSKNDDMTNESSWTNSRYIYIITLMGAFIFLMLAGLMGRFLIETLVLSLCFIIAGWLLFLDPKSDTEKLLSDMFRWGVYWIILGLVFEPFEGGIKKDKATMSYYFVTAGLAIFMLIAYTIIIDVFKKKKYLQLIIDNGQNPMIGYAGITNLVPPIMGLLGIWAQPAWLKPYPWLGAIRGLLITLALGYMVKAFTKMKIFLRT